MSNSGQGLHADSDQQLLIRHSSFVIRHFFMRVLSNFRYLFISLLFWQCSEQPEYLFDGTSFNGWEGDTVNTWKIVDNSLVGGSLQDTVPHNDFLCTTKRYSDFVLRLKFRLTGNGGFINAGVQFRSERLRDPAYEMTGYQADLGAGYWGSLYDESRRNKVLAAADTIVISKTLNVDGWNDYEIRAEGKRIRLSINGVETVDYTEPDDSIPQEGVIGLQIHGGGKAKVEYKDLQIAEING